MPRFGAVLTLSGTSKHPGSAMMSLRCDGTVRVWVASAAFVDNNGRSTAAVCRPLRLLLLSSLVPIDSRA
eukprot:11217956-Heterocapsa_arctica.AAC.1